MLLLVKTFFLLLLHFKKDSSDTETLLFISKID